jgi:hypothetical protein
MEFESAFYYLSSHFFYSIIPYLTTLCYIIGTLKPIFFRIPNFTNKKLEEDIKDSFKDLISKTNITKNIQFRIIKHSQFCSARGMNFFNPCIFLPPKLDEIDKNILSFIIKHELAHIKNNDCFFIPLLGLIVNIVSRMLINSIKTRLPLLNILPQIIPFLSIVLLSRYREKKADNYAIENSTDEELEAAIIFFKALDSINPHSYLLDLIHPSLSQRISNIENILYNSNTEKKNDLQKNIKIKTIRDLIINVISNN